MARVRSPSTTPSRRSTSTGTRSPRARPAPSCGALNYELALGEANTIGATYLKFQADPLVKPARDGMNVYNLRAYLAPFSGCRGWRSRREYAQRGQRRPARVHRLERAGCLRARQGELEAQDLLPLRLLRGRRPRDAADEAFDSLLPGFYDWGTWWQGEIAGEYFLSNSNLISHQVRLHVTPSDAFGAGLIGYVFQADQPAVVRARRSRPRDLATELDAYADWKLNSNFTRESSSRRSPTRRTAVKQAYRPDRELHLRNGLRRVQLLATRASELASRPQGGAGHA